MSALVMESLTARDLMTREVVSIPPTMPVASVARLLADRGISAVPVLAPNGRMLGIVTELDLIRRLSGAEDMRPGLLRRLLGNRDRDAERDARVHGMLAEDVMTRDVICVDEDSSAEHIAHLMEEHGIRRVPVVREERLVGIVSRADLLQALLVPPAPLGSGSAEDERIRADLWREIREQPWADTFYTYVNVQDGIVEFQGYARSSAVRRAAGHGAPDRGRAPRERHHGARPAGQPPLLRPAAREAAMCPPPGRPGGRLPPAPGAKGGAMRPARAAHPGSGRRR